MNRLPHALVIAALAFGLVGPLAARARAASVTKVDRNAWAMGANVPSYVTMYIYVPDKPATNPPIVVACHACGTAVSGYVNSLSTIQSKANANGFILILPEATGRNCWDVGSAAALKHDGGGDTQALAQMVKYALGKYSGDASRVYVMGGSSGAMMTQAMLAVYPDVFKAGSARAGVPAGCWADGYDPVQQWSDNCAGGRTNRTAQQWGDGVRAMYASFTGQRPRLQLFHGTSDATINYNNMTEAIEEWTNVLGLPTAPTSTDMITTPISLYTRQFWRNACNVSVFETWSAKNGGHSMNYEQDAILAFFGLDKVGSADPASACAGDGGISGPDDRTGTGGTDGGAGGHEGGGSGGAGGNGGNPGAPSSSGHGGRSGISVAGGRAGTPGAIAAGGSPASGVAGTPGSGSDSGAGGCSYGPGSGSTGALAALAMGLTLFVSRRRR